jgi:hypothetical protein
LESDEVTLVREHAGLEERWNCELRYFVLAVEFAVK